jgi:hypothetical protein
MFLCGENWGRIILPPSLETTQRGIFVMAKTVGGNLLEGQEKLAYSVPVHFTTFIK